MDLRLLPSRPLLLSPSKPHFPLQSLSRRPHLPFPSLSTSGIKTNSNNLRIRVSCSLPSENNAVDENTDSEHKAAKEGKGIVSSGLDSSDSPGIWRQMKEIALFAGPATGLWICGPLMSLIDTMVIGQISSLELAALGNDFF